MGRWQNSGKSIAVSADAPLGPSGHVPSVEEIGGAPSLSKLQHTGAGTAAAATVRYLLGGYEKVIEFPADRHDDVSGALPSAPSGPLRDYEDKLKAIDLCARGMEKAEIAKLLERSEHWVKRWWRQCPETIPRPNLRHSPLTNNAPLMAFRDLELKRDFASVGRDGRCECAEGSPEIFDELRAKVEWKPARCATRDAVTGALKVRFTSSGSSIAQPKRHVAEYRKGTAPRVDSILWRMFEAANIQDTRARIFMNYYEDGGAVCPSHRHDFWTCMLSFGADRVALIEDRPIFLRSGDLLIFGTQAHSLPLMPDVDRGRISVVVFYRPEGSSVEKRWATIDSGCPDEEDEEPSSVDARLRLSNGHATTAAGRLVDTELLGCPGISLGFYGRQGARISKPVTIFTVYGGHLPEAAFFNLLRERQINDLWDIRLSTRGDAMHFSAQSLRASCAARLLTYIGVPLGRAEAGGLRRHLACEEGKDVITRALQAAELGRVALLCEGSFHEVITESLICGEFGPVTVTHISASEPDKSQTARAEPIADQGADISISNSCGTVGDRKTSGHEIGASTLGESARHNDPTNTGRVGRWRSQGS